MTDYDVIIIGGGVAGLSAALTLKKTNINVLVIEKHEYPKHKVCGEYVSNEVLPLLNHFGIGVFENGAVPITTMGVSLQSGKAIQNVTLPLGGFGLSRFALDLALYKKAISKGVEFKFDTVNAVAFEDDYLNVKSTTKSYTAKLVIGAYGKRSNLDKQFKRNFITQKTEWIGVKAHYRTKNFDSHSVGLHHFEGGYAGLSMVENNHVNCCYLCSTKNFTQAGSIANFQKQIAVQNPFLDTFFSDAEMVFEKPLSIAQVSFAPKSLVHKHMLFCGDAAGLIHPLCGNGIAMGLHGGYVLGNLCLDYLNGHLPSRETLSQEYIKLWHTLFSKRLNEGRRLQKLLLHKNLNAVLLKSFKTFPTLLQKVIKRTHGKPIFIQ